MNHAAPNPSPTPGGSEAVEPDCSYLLGQAPEGKCWIYVARCGEHVKIGMTKNIKKRFSSLRNGSAKRIICRYVHLVDANLARDVERAAQHNIGIPSMRIRSEWFLATTEQAGLALDAAVKTFRQ